MSLHRPLRRQRLRARAVGPMRETLEGVGAALPADLAEALRYVQRRAQGTGSWLSHVLVTATHKDARITAFLSTWAYEAHWFGDALSAIAGAGPVPGHPPRHRGEAARPLRPAARGGRREPARPRAHRRADDRAARRRLDRRRDARARPAARPGGRRRGPRPHPGGDRPSGPLLRGVRDGGPLPLARRARARPPPARDAHLADRRREGARGRDRGARCRPCSAPTAPGPPASTAASTRCPGSPGCSWCAARSASRDGLRSGSLSAAPRASRTAPRREGRRRASARHGIRHRHLR